MAWLQMALEVGLMKSVGRPMGLGIN